jgi:hypothetical protein
MLDTHVSRGIKIQRGEKIFKVALLLQTLQVIVNTIGICRYKETENS